MRKYEGGIIGLRIFNGVIYGCNTDLIYFHNFIIYVRNYILFFLCLLHINKIYIHDVQRSVNYIVFFFLSLSIYVSVCLFFEFYF